MPRKRNEVPTVTITLSTTPQVQESLGRLVSTGYYGKNAAEAAERLVAWSLEKLDHEARLPRKRRR